MEENISNTKTLIPIICIEGATGSGKSNLALKLAKALNTEIISADSRQIYKYLNIGTAKPTQNELAEVKHHLIDLITPEQRYNVGMFIKDSENIIENLCFKKKIPIVCGGSMLYIKSLLNGLSEIPEIPPEIKIKTMEYMKDNNLSACYELIKKIDPKFYSMIYPTDKQRISRALEVWFAYETPITHYWKKNEILKKYEPFRIYIDKERNMLYDKINKRMINMINQGLINEIQSILEMGYQKDDIGLNSVGYKEFLDIIISKDYDKLPERIELAAQHTRNYAKRQLTWYRKEHFDVILKEECIETNHVINLFQLWLKNKI